GAAVLGGNKSCYLVPKLLEAEVIDGNTDDGEVLREKLGLRQVEQRRHQLAFCQITGCAEEHHGARTGSSTQFIIAFTRLYRHISHGRLTVLLRTRKCGNILGHRTGVLKGRARVRISCRAQEQGRILINPLSSWER